MKRMHLLFAVMIMAMAVLNGCNNTTQGGLNDPIDSGKEEMGFLIKLPGEANGTARTAYYQSSDAASYKLNVIFNKEIIDTKTGLPGETLKVIVSEEGTYDFSVFAYDKTGTVIGEGNTSSRIARADGIVPVKITINPKAIGGIELEFELLWDNIDNPSDGNSKSNIYTFTEPKSKISGDISGKSGKAEFAIYLMNRSAVNVLSFIEDYNPKMLPAGCPAYRLGAHGNAAFATGKNGTFGVAGITDSQSYSGVAVTIDQDNYTLIVDKSKLKKTEFFGIGRGFGENRERQLTEDDEFAVNDFIPVILGLSDSDGEDYISDLNGAQLVKMKASDISWPDDISPAVVNKSSVYTISEKIQNISSAWGGSCEGPSFTVLLMNDTAMNLIKTGEIKNIYEMPEGSPVYQIQAYGNMSSFTAEDGDYVVFGMAEEKTYTGIAWTNKDDTYTFTVDLSKIDKTQMKGVGKDFGTDGEKIITVDDEVDLSDYTPYVLALSDTKGEGYISDLWVGRIVRMNEGGTFPEILNPIP